MKRLKAELLRLHLLENEYGVDAPLEPTPDMARYSGHFVFMGIVLVAVVAIYVLFALKQTGQL